MKKLMLMLAGIVLLASFVLDITTNGYTVAQAVDNAWRMLTQSMVLAAIFTLLSK